MQKIAMIVFTAGLFFSTPVLSQGVFQQEKLPEALSDWVDWVLYDVPNHECPTIGEEPVCLWPGSLALSLDDKGGTFLQESFADLEMPLLLPGNATFWPQDVTVDGRAAPVIEQGSLPTVLLLKGSHRIAGRFIWESLPEGIDVPLSCGIIDLTLNGKPVSAKRDESGRLWLASAAQSEDEEQLTLSVWRKLTDGVPLMMETRIAIRASGKAREVTLDAVLPNGVAPLSVSGPLPARLDNNGNLKLQIRPGNHVIEISARTLNQPKSLAPKPHAGPWPKEEVWVWQADEKLRQVTLDGAPGIDPSRTDLPDEWRALPAFVLDEKSRLQFTTTRQGETHAPPDRLNLNRALWLDLDQEGFTVRDEIVGTLNRTWRIDLETEGVLGRVSVDGEDQLITKSVHGKSGAELRRGDLRMTAEWHIDRQGADLPAVGWSEDVMGLRATLNLSPGWTLLFAEGVDTVRNTWWDRWNLFGFFFVLIISIATAKLTKWWWGIVALVGLVLAHNEPEAPFAVWPALLIALALVKVLKKGRLRIAALAVFSAAVIWLVCVLAPFDVYEIRNGLFPQIAMEGVVVSEEITADKAYAITGKYETDLPPAPQEAKKADEDVGIAQQAEPIPLDNTMIMRKGNISDFQGNRKIASLRQQSSAVQDPKAVVQTGMGIPTWRWNSWQLEWSGPVKKDHRISLYMISPRINLFLSFFQVLLLTLLGLNLIMEGVKAGRNNKPIAEKIPPMPAAAAVALMIASIVAPTSLFAQEKGEGTDEAVPSKEILDTLRERLTALPLCNPDCVSVSRLDIHISDDIATITAEVHAAAASSVMIPGPAENWTPKSAALDGRPTAAVVLRDDGFLHARIEKGIHRLVATGPMPNIGALVLSLGMPPKYVTVTADGWIVDGLRDNNRAEGSLQFTRVAKAERDKSTGSIEEGAFPPWLEITRNVDLGIPWTVVTTVRRVSPLGTPVLTTVPLLPKESVTDSELKVTADGVVVSLGRDDETISWTSTLKEQESISFIAPEGTPWSEVWTVQCSPIWQCAFDGILPVEHKTDGVLRPVFKPWPNEKMILKVTKPKGVEGTSITIDSADLRMTPGTRLAKGSLSLKIRTSRGGEQKVVLPEGATIQTLTLDGASHPFQNNGQQIVVPLKTGAQTILIDWQMNVGLKTRYVVPGVRIGGPAANVHVAVDMPNDRWLLFVGGPSWGPAVLFWGFLLAVLLAGFILGRYSESPLKSHQWMLLFAGLTQVPIPVALIITAWFLVIARRSLHPFARPVLFNIAQIFLILITAVTIVCIIAAVYAGLAVQPDMQAQGMGSTDASLVWYIDRISDQLPSPWVISLPILVWKVIMLAWALWLAADIVRWAPWAWRSFTSEGIWKKSQKARKSDTPPISNRPSAS